MADTIGFARLTWGSLGSRAVLLAVFLSLGACGRTGDQSPSDGGDRPADGASPSDGVVPSDGAGGDDGSTARDGAAPSDGSPPDAAAPHIDLRVVGGSVRKAFPLADGVLVLIDVPLDLNLDWGFPKRELRAVDAAGNVLWHVATTTDRELLDFAAHPSGEVSALFASVAGFRLVRIDAGGTVRADFPLVNDGVDTD